MTETICEIWKPINGYEDLYEISNVGRVKRIAREYTCRQWQGGTSHYKLDEMILKLRKTPQGYYHINLYRRVNGKCVSDRRLIHRLVAEHFVDNPDGLPCVNHLDAIPTNNVYTNLEWCTQSHNIQYAYDIGTKKPPGEKAVKQFSLDGRFLNEWKSIAEAARKCGTYTANIQKVIKGKRSQAGGYKWKYAR